MPLLNTCSFRDSTAEIRIYFRCACEWLGSVWARRQTLQPSLKSVFELGISRYNQKPRMETYRRKLREQVRNGWPSMKPVTQLSASTLASNFGACGFTVEMGLRAKRDLRNFIGESRITMTFFGDTFELMLRPI